MATGKVTPEEALEDEALSPETSGLLKMLASFGFPALNIILLLFVMLQTQTHHEENRRNQAAANEDQRQFLELLAENLEHLHQNDAMLADRLRHAGEAQLVEIEEGQSTAPRKRRTETETAPKRQSPKPKPTRKKKKGKKRD